MARPTVLYDGDCGFCRWSANVLRSWDRGSRIAFLPIGSATAEELLRNVPVELRSASWHLVDEHGTVWSAEEAVPEVLSRLPLGTPFATLTAACPGPTGRAYRWIARHRSRLGRVLGQRACAVDPSRT